MKKINQGNPPYIKEQMYMMSRDAKKAYDKNSAPLNTFNSQQTGYRRQISSSNKGHWWKHLQLTE